MKHLTTCLKAVGLFAVSHALYAAGVNMPWSQGLTSISNNVTVRPPWG
jgi:hypothetical protein